MFYVVFNGCKDTDLGLKTTTRPSVSVPQKNIDEIEVAGRDGTLIRDHGTYKNIEIKVSYNFVDRTDFNNKCRIIKKWINKIEDNKLQFSDDLGFFYKVKYCKLDAIERVYKALGKFELTFICEPYMYSSEGQQTVEVINGSNIVNNGLQCKPTYIINGTGLIALQINNKDEVKINLDGKITIDTDLYICYKNGVMSNTDISGYYENLWLDEYSDNIFTITGDNISLIEIMPNFREL